MAGFAQGLLVGCVTASFVVSGVWATAKVGPSREQQVCALRAVIERTSWYTQQHQAAMLREMEGSQRASATNMALAWAMTSDPIQRAGNARTAARFVADTERSAQGYRLQAEGYEADARSAAERAMRQCPEAPR